MIVDVFKEDDPESCDVYENKLNLKEILLLAVATSIDALAVGISMAFLGVDIGPAALLIGVTTFVDVYKRQADNMYSSRRLSKLLLDAEKIAERFKDEYVSVEHMYLALLEMCIRDRI